MTQPDRDLVWYFCDSASELGMRAAAMGDDSFGASNTPQQHWPTAKMCRAARRQRDIRDALHQLSGQLQSVLECTYEAQGLTVQERHAHDLAAPLIARVLMRMKEATPPQQKKLRNLIQNAPMLVQAAHDAFRIVYGTPDSSSRPAQRRARVERWMQQEGLRG